MLYYLRAEGMNIGVGVTTVVLSVKGKSECDENDENKEYEGAKIQERIV